MFELRITESELPLIKQLHVSPTHNINAIRTILNKIAGINNFPLFSPVSFNQYHMLLKNSSCTVFPDLISNGIKDVVYSMIRSISRPALSLQNKDHQVSHI